MTRGQALVVLAVRPDLDLGAQIIVSWATWLDRLVIDSEPITISKRLRRTELQQAMDQRISCVLDIICAFIWWEVVGQGADTPPCSFDGSLVGLAQQAFEL